jgi:hypothetical protein
LVLKPVAAATAANALHVTDLRNPLEPSCGLAGPAFVFVPVASRGLCQIGGNRNVLFHVPARRHYNRSEIMFAKLDP